MKNVIVEIDVISTIDEVTTALAKSKGVVYSVSMNNTKAVMTMQVKFSSVENAKTFLTEYDPSIAENNEFDVYIIEV